MSKNSIELTKEELQSDHVAAGIAKWGESERKGIEKQARAKSLETLRVEYDLRHATSEAEKEAACKASMARQKGPVIYPEFGLDGNS